MKVELEIPKRYESLLKEIDVKSLLETSLKNAFKDEFLRKLRFKLALADLEKLSKKSKLNKAKARELSERLKEQVWKRHQK
jgi:uncharacterized 2Fe-2S/4Fe-4S cluster protein (DUF4445 family)